MSDVREMLAVFPGYNKSNEQSLLSKTRGGGGATSLQEANGDVPLVGVAFSRLDLI